MKIERLPSGNYRIRIYVGEENGKKKWKSCTGRTKAEAMKKAAVMDSSNYSSLPLEDACEQFLQARANELSPSTMRGYRSTLCAYIVPDKIARIRLENITTPMLQSWIKNMDVSAKTKKNHLGFVLTVLRYFEIEKVFRVRIAQEEPKEMYTPTMDEVNKVIACADKETARAIALACFGLRRGEICALTAEDLNRDDNTVRVYKAYAKAPGNKFVLKMPKTKKSVRIVPITEEVMRTLPTSGRVISCSPDCITNRFVHAVNRAGVPHFRFHDLRSFSASISLSPEIGASRTTVKDLHGWKTDRMLQDHYERSIRDQKQKDIESIRSYFSKNLQID